MALGRKLNLQFLRRFAMCVQFDLLVCALKIGMGLGCLCLFYTRACEVY